MYHPSPLLFELDKCFCAPLTSQAEEQRRIREAAQESQVLVAVATGAEEGAVRRAIVEQEQRTGKTMTARIKEWALSGLTPPEKEAGGKEAGQDGVEGQGKTGWWK